MRTNWKSRPAMLRGTALLIGLSGYGFSMAMMVRAGLGLDPWDVFHQGLATHTGMTIGIASAVVGVAVLLAWIPLRNRPGVGTIANVIVIAITVDAGMLLLPTPTSLPVRIAMMLGAVVLNAFSTVLYVGAGLGPGPRDGLMTGLVVRTGLSVQLVRTSIEATVLAVGWLLGGTVGIGTVIYAFGIGPLVQMFLRITPKRVLAVSGWAAVAEPAIWACKVAPSARITPKSQRRPAGWRAVTVRHDGRVPEDDAADPDLLIDFARVALRRGGQVLVGPVTWSVELDERWVVIGPNGAGKTSLLRIAAATGASVVGHGLRARRAAGPGRHGRTAVPCRAVAVPRFRSGCPMARWCATSWCRPDTP